MPRSRTRSHFDECRLISGKRTGCGIEAINHQFIGSKVGNEHEVIVAAGRNFVRVWRSLTVLVHAGPRALNKRAAFAELPVLLNGKDSDVSTVIVRYQN